MEALEALCLVATSSGRSSSSASGSAGSVGCVDRSMKTEQDDVCAAPWGKRKQRSAAAKAVSSSDVVKDEQSDNECDQFTPKKAKGESGDASSPGLLAVKQQGDCEDKACSGCYRSQITGLDWWDTSAKVKWANPNDRGYWCADCHMRWRTQYSLTHMLSLFGQWLKVEANRSEWDLVLLAFLILWQEQNSRITSGMIVDRLRLLTWMFSFLGLPLKPSVLFPIEASPSCGFSSSSSDDKSTTPG
jgi:hypothetical protein